MKRWMIPTLGLALSLAPWTAGAEPFDGSKPLLCALTEALGCGPDGECQRGEAHSLDLPTFVSVDLKKNEIREHGGSRATKIASQQRLDGLILLQGVQERAWSLAISPETRRLTFTASGNDEGFVVFGNCTEL
jgi:hypothetical protein